MRVLLTRPLDDSLMTAQILEQKGIDSLITPLFDLVTQPRIFDHLTSYQALLFTSRHAIRVFTAQNSLHDTPVFCVGDQTASEAERHGFTTVYSAQGDTVDLVRLITARCRPEQGPLLRLQGEMADDPLVDALRQAGYMTDTAVLYAMQPRDSLPEETCQFLQQGQLDGVCLYSPRAAREFTRLVERRDLAKACRSLAAWCISEATAAALSPLVVKTLMIAPRPTQDSLLDLINAYGTIPHDPSS